MINIVKFRAFICLISLFLLFPSVLTANPTGLTLGIHPYLPALELRKRFTPLTEYLSEALDTRVTLKISPDYKEHTRRTAQGEIDIAYLGPAPFVKVQQLNSAIRPLARLEVRGKPVFYGKIVCRSDANINSLQDLKGKRFAFGSKRSTMSYLVPRYELEKHGIFNQLDSYGFIGSHKNVALAVMLGQYDAGAVKEEVFDEYQPKGMKLIKDTMAISEHLFVASSQLEQSLADRIKLALLNISTTKNGMPILTSIKSSVTGLVDVKPSDYDNLRQVLDQLKPVSAP